MPESFGARLRQHRESQGIDLFTIAERTKIKLPLLEALERDDVSSWPSGIFRRAFSRAYAQAIGLDPDIVVREFLEVHPEPAEVAAAALAAAAAADAARANGGPQTRLRHLMGSALGSLSFRRRSVPIEMPPAADPSPIMAAPPMPAPPVPAPPPEPVREAVARRSPEPAPVESREAAVVDCVAPKQPPVSELDLSAVAQLCTRFGRVATATEIQPLLQDAARILDAVGLIVWVWDPLAEELRPALVHGYSDRVVAQLPPVRRDADNPTAAAFRSADARAVGPSDRASGALVVPLLTPAGCAGVLAIELQREREPAQSARAVATIFAALLAQLIGDRVADAAEEPERIDPPTNHFAEGFDRVTTSINA